MRIALHLHCSGHKANNHAVRQVSELFGKWGNEWLPAARFKCQVALEPSCWTQLQSMTEMQNPFNSFMFCSSDFLCAPPTDRPGTQSEDLDVYSLFKLPFACFTMSNVDQVMLTFPAKPTAWWPDSAVRSPLTKRCELHCTFTAAVTKQIIIYIIDIFSRWQWDDQKRGDMDKSFCKLTSNQLCTASNSPRSSFVFVLNCRGRCGACLGFWNLVSLLTPPDYPVHFYRWGLGSQTPTACPNDGLPRTEDYVDYCGLAMRFRAMVMVPHGNVPWSW